MRLIQGRVLEAIFLMEQSLRARPHLTLLQHVFYTLLRFALRLSGGRN